MTVTHKDRVTPALRSTVLLRDGACVLFLLALERPGSPSPWHICRDVWGNEHSPYDLDKLTLEHVKDQPRMGRRAPSDPAHLVAMCYQGNVGVPSKKQREAIRAYLSTREPKR